MHEIAGNEIQKLREENGKLKQALTSLATECPYPGTWGCSDGNCIVSKPKGMHTNGGCQHLKDIDGGWNGYQNQTAKTLSWLRQQARHTLAQVLEPVK